MNPFNFKVSLNNTQFESKPKNNEIGIISKNIQCVELSIPELSKALEKGQTFTPSFFQDDKRINNNFRGTYVFALDFDDNQDHKEKINLLEQYGIKTNIYYPSFSDTPQHRKFRLVIIFDEVINDRKLRDKIQQALMHIVKDSDKACKDAARMFYGSNKSYVLYDEPNTLQQVLIHLQNIINTNTSKRTRVRNNELFENGTNTLVPYNTIRDYQESAKIEVKQHYDFENACEVSSVLNDFANGGHLSYKPLFNLISNMNYVKGGFKWVENIMVESGTYNETDFELLRTFRSNKYNYLPESIATFDADLIDQYSNIYSLDRPSREVEILKQSEKLDSDDIYNKFSLEFEKIANRAVLKENWEIDTPRINVIKASVGIGKSHKIKRQLIGGKTVFAFPTHQLKKQFEKDIKVFNVPYTMTPEIPVFHDDELNSQYKYYQNIGDSAKANQLIKEVAARDISKENMPMDKQDIIKAKGYLIALESAYNSPYAVLTTHQRAILTPNSFKGKDHIIFDEDILQTLLPHVGIKVSDIERVIKSISTSENDEDIHFNQYQRKLFETDLRAIIDYLNTLPNAVIKPTEKMVLQDRKSLVKRLSLVKGGENLIKFIDSDFILRYRGQDDIDNFYCIKKMALPADKQITIISATADRWLYDKFFGSDNYNFADLGTAKNINPIIQYTGKRYSKTSLNKGEKPVINDNSIVISYKDFKREFENFDDIVHFGNTTGYNHLTGQNLSIVGTPIIPKQIVMLYAEILGIEYNSKDTEYSKQDVSLEIGDNLIKFPLHTYENEDLSNIEIRLAQAEIEQAAGRGRANRTDSIIEIFSAIPTPSADIYKYKKEV